MVHSPVRFGFVHLLTMDHQTTGRVEFSRAMIALEVLRFLML
jgi:hypothetical protein